VAGGSADFSGCIPLQWLTPVCSVGFFVHSMPRPPSHASMGRGQVENQRGGLRCMFESDFNG
jgi:hypothetical protein